MLTHSELAELRRHTNAARSAFAQARNAVVEAQAAVDGIDALLVGLSDAQYDALNKEFIETLSLEQHDIVVTLARAITMADAAVANLDGVAPADEADEGGAARRSGGV
jgi:hypothetical protein